MLRRAFLLCLLLLPGTALAQWSSEAVQALPYLYHEDELKNDLSKIDEVMGKYYTLQLRDYYLNEVNKSPYVVQNYAAPLTFDDLTNDYINLYQTLLNEFQQAAANDKDDLLSRLENEERQQFKTELSSEDMVALKDFYLAMPRFFDLPLSFSNFVSFAGTVESQPKHDLATRQPLAQHLADLLMPHEANYAIQGDELHAISPDVVDKNLAAYLANEFTAAQLTTMVNFAESEPGSHYLAMKDMAFKNRFLTFQDIYQRELAHEVDNLRARITALPPPVIVYPLHPIRRTP